MVNASEMEFSFVVVGSIPDNVICFGAAGLLPAQRKGGLRGSPPHNCLELISYTVTARVHCGP